MKTELPKPVYKTHKSGYNKTDNMMFNKFSVKDNAR